MKTPIILKLFLILSILLFVDYVLMVIIGCATCLLGFSSDFYCGPYCIFGKIILTLSAVLFGAIIFPDIVKLFKPKKDISTI
jgi:hypothetical protein